ncbi:MAG: TIGR04190 family B12-binding domain/radical SAM domain protein [Thermoplasmata archaeon]|jgi:B12-binding domain/radical SAM domain protein|nr:TIGR04190 family B12-binding domain/radical SAM domain protein [Thermoplasmata archaeon]
MYDLVLLHAPSIYDFRKRVRDYGPVSDVIPSTPIFEMYPIGFVSILSELMPLGYRVKIENLAVEMLLDKNFDAEKKIKQIDSDIFSIDLHWLPHVHGALNIARIVKKYHPESAVMLGGLSSTYYHNEIINNYDFIDFILLGDTTEPFLPELIDSFQKKRGLENVPNLVWRENGKIRINKIQPPEDYINKVRLDYKYLIKQCVRSFSVKSALPYSDWIISPSGMTFIEKGCHHNCVICGGSKFAYEHSYFRKSVSYRSVENVVNDLLSIQENLGVPAFIIGDVHEAGQKYEEELLRKIKENGIDIPIMFEIFNPAPESFYSNLERNVSEYTMEISPESSDENVRAYAGRYYNNLGLEKTVEYAKKHGARKMDVFFSIGISHQTRETVLKDIEYMGKMYDRYGSWIHLFTSPIAPFVDPGSLAFELNEKYGYRIFARTLKEHYDLLENSRSWVDSLNYETFWLTRIDIGKLSLEAGYLIAKMKKEKNLPGSEINMDLIEQFMNNISHDGANPLPRNYIGPIIYDKEELVWSKNIKIKNMNCFFVNLYRNFLSAMKK